MISYLTEADRLNMHRLVEAERLDELRRYAKAAIALIDERRLMDPNRPVIANLPGMLSFGRKSFPDGHFLTLSPEDIFEGRNALAALRAVWTRIDEVVDPYALTGDVEAVYHAVQFLDRILPPEPEPKFEAPDGWCAPA